ncbi:MAG: dihydrofolate reductase family protein [Bryobacteraceae bacterium]|nr:dihydrofolate reductase family protein [Bryobacteraceae bacterium]
MPTRSIRYTVAASLDGYIAGPNEEVDWIVIDPDIDFAAMFARFDTLIMGRKTYEVTVGLGETGFFMNCRVVVFSRTLTAAPAGIEVHAGPPEPFVEALLQQPGKDICLFGGGLLFRALAAARLVHGVEVAVIPVLLGGGVPLFPPPAPRVPLRLNRHRLYEKSGIVWMDYQLL